LKHRVLVLGAGGQLARELVRSAPAQTDCIALAREELDIGDAHAVERCVAALAPQVLINAAAYTAVDAAERDRDAAWRVNALGPENLARASAERGLHMLHVSTDFVFDGEASTPYSPAAITAPLGEYGRSKLAGEQAVLRIHPRALVLRSSWVYSRYGSNFVKTMLRLMAERQELAVVADQRGTPTWAAGLAAALWAAAERPAVHGIYHWSDGGECSWYDFAVAICEEACALGLLARAPAIRAITSAEYPTPARRPRYSVLDTSAARRDLELPGVDWRLQLRAMLTDLKELQDE
jgi:dTDP-4-dehydrorhamnose reductase